MSFFLDTVEKSLSRRPYVIRPHRPGLYYIRHLRYAGREVVSLSEPVVGQE